jgi:hypothetical protein
MLVSWYRKTWQGVKFLTKFLKYQSGFALYFNIEERNVSGLKLPAKVFAP